MTWHEYMEAKELLRHDPPFYALLMAAAHLADSTNAAKLERLWPELWAEVKARYNAPAGLLDGEGTPAQWALEKYGLA